MRRLAAGAAALACTGTLASGAAAASAPTASLTKWNEISAAAFAGGRLVALDTETVVVRGAGTGGRPGPVAFTYWKSEAVTAGLTGNRLRFSRAAFDTAVAVRTSIGSLTGSRLTTAGPSFLLVGGGRGFPPPVVWCCDLDDREVVVESDGRADAPAAFAGGFDGTRVRWLLRRADGSVTLASASPQLLGSPDDVDGTRTDAPLAIRPARGLAAIAPGILAWADPPAAGVVQVAVPSDAGIGATVPYRVGGRVLGVWADTGLVAALTRTGALKRVVRIDTAAGTSRVVWSGRRTPRVAVGGGAVVVADGRRILAARSGTLRRVAQARGDVAAVAVDGDRAAWFERLQRRVAGTTARLTVARLGRVPR